MGTHDYSGARRAGAGATHVTLNNLEAASHLLATDNTSNRACMDYERKAGPADINCIREGQRKIRRFRQLLAK